jgi:hypothetical protein
MPEKKENQKKKAGKKTEREKPEELKDILPPLEFSSFVLPFFTQALIKLGLAEDPLAKTEEVNLDLAKRMIDLLDLLKERTKGNLKSEEEKLLSACLHQLKIAFMEKAKIIKL